MDWTLIGIITSAIVSLTSIGLSVYNARVNKDTTEIDNLRKIIETQGAELEKLSNKVIKLEEKDRRKTEAIHRAFACKKYGDDLMQCPVIQHIS